MLTNKSDFLIGLAAGAIAGVQDISCLRATKSRF